MNEEELAQVLAMAESYKAQLASLSKQEEMIQVSRHEHEKAKETLQSYSEMEDGAEILVSAGAETYVPARLGPPGKVVITIGSGIHVEDTVKGALERLESRLTEIDKAAKALQDRGEKLETELAKIEQVIELESEKMQKKQQAGR